MGRRHESLETGNREDQPQNKKCPEEPDWDSAGQDTFATAAVADNLPAL